MINVSPEKLVVKEGDEAKFSCSVEAGSPAPEVIFFVIFSSFVGFLKLVSFLVSSLIFHHGNWQSCPFFVFVSFLISTDMGLPCLAFYSVPILGSFDSSF